VRHRSGAGRLAAYRQTLQLVANWRRSSIANTGTLKLQDWTLQDWTMADWTLTSAIVQSCNVQSFIVINEYLFIIYL